MATHIVNAFSNTCFNNNQIITSVDLHNIPWKNNSMYAAFYNCINLQTITNINQNVINMVYAFEKCDNLIDAPTIPNSVTNIHGVFYHCDKLCNISNIPNSVTDLGQTFVLCTNLVNIPEIPNSVVNMQSTFSYCNKIMISPVIPNSVINMVDTFSHCTNLIDAPVIPNSVINMRNTFYNCSNLVNAPVIGNSVTNMYATFQYCTNLVNAPVIPNSVTNIGWCFSSCDNLTGNINIYSNNIIHATGCFNFTSKNKNVYIPFKYDNGVYTQTYNSFTAAGYSTTERVNGVLLMDINPPSIYTTTITTTPDNATITMKSSLEEKTGIGTLSITSDPNEIISYTVSAEGYETDYGYIVADQVEKEVPIILSDGSAVSLTIVPNPLEATVTITYNGETTTGIGITRLDNITKYDTVTWDVFYQDESHHMTNKVYMSKSQTINVDVSAARYKVSAIATYSDKSDPFYGYCVAKSSEGITLFGPAYFDREHETQIYVPVGDTVDVGFFTEDFKYATGLTTSSGLGVTLTVYPSGVNSTYYLPSDSRVYTKESSFGLEIPCFEDTITTYNGQLCHLKKYYQPRWFSVLSTNLITTISREHFVEYTESHKINWKANTTVYKVLESDEDNWKAVTFNTTPVNATVIVMADTQSLEEGKTTLVKTGANISYTVSAEGYTTVTGTDTISTNKIIEVVLEEAPKRKYIETEGYEFTNTNDTVSFTKYTGTSITVTVPTIQEE